MGTRAAVVVRAERSSPNPWERALSGVELLPIESLPHPDARATLGRAGCALVDGTFDDPIGVVRRIHTLEPPLQVIIVSAPETRGEIQRRILFTPGAGEVWTVDPDDVGESLVERASTVTRQRRRYQGTRDRIEHALAVIEPNAGRRSFVSDAFLAALLDILPDAVISVDRRGEILSWNPAAEQILGTPREGAVGKHVKEVLDAEGPSDPDRLLRTPGGVIREALNFRRSDGEKRIAEISVVPVEAAGHRVSAVILHDVTEERRVQEERESQAAEVEMQAEELQRQTAQLEETQVELEMANDALTRANSELTERTEEAEQARTRAEVATGRLEAILRQMPSGVIVAEAPHGRVILGNERVEIIWRRPLLDLQEIADYDRFPAFHPDGRVFAPEEWPLARSLNGETVLEEEIRIERGDGTRGTVIVRSAPIRDADGRVVAAVAIVDDVSERKEREEEQAFLAEASRVLSSSLEHQRTLESVARLAVPRIADWCAVDVRENGSVHRLAVVHSDPSRERLAHEIQRRWPTDPEGDSALVQVLRTGEPVLIPEVSDDVLRQSARDEEHYRLLKEIGLRSAMLVPMVAGGRTLGVITLVAAESGRRYGQRELHFAEQLASRAAIAVDNARFFRETQEARREAEHAQARAEDARGEAEAANRAKSEFLATMSHEIRTPINAIIGYTDLLEMGIAGPITEGQKAQLDRVRESSQHLMMLIEDVLDLAKVEAGRLEVAQERVPAARAVAAAMSLVELQAVDARITIESSCTGDWSTYYVGDEDRVRQIIVNLLSNAVKFTDPGGTVRVSCGTSEDPDRDAALARPGSWAYIRVEDTGIGIAPDEMEAVFQPFVQGEGGLTRTHGGTGLGLPISRQLARVMRGDLTVESEQGRGSAFTLWLPAEAAEGELVHQEALLVDGATDEPPAGTARIGEALREEIVPILDRFVQRLADDPAIPVAATLSRADLEDHASSFLIDISRSLVILEASDAKTSDILRDGTEIQRVINQLHGAQRARLGWAEEALTREFEILREEVEAGVRRRVSLQSEIDEAIALLRRVLEHAERISLHSLRRTQAARH